MDRGAGPAMWVLPVRADHAGGGSSQSESPANAPADYRWHGRQYLPLWDVSADCPGHRARDERRITMPVDSDTACPPQAYRLSRRSLLLQAGGISIALGLGSHSVEAFAEQLAELPQQRELRRPNAWVTIGTDDLITLISPASEMGQGVMTAIPLLIAEEMDADWQKVRILQAPNAKAYGNPKFGGAQATGGSQTTRAFFDPLRLVGAQTRNILIASASAMLGAPIDELTTEPNVVVHRATERKLSYGEIAANGRIPDPIPQVTLTDLKPATDWRYLGKDLPRIDIPSKVDGSACFGIDIL